MIAATADETQGAWLVHHGEKVIMDAHGAAEFPAIEQAAKAASLLVRLSASEDALLQPKQVEAIARAARLNPRIELQAYLATLEQKRLIQKEGLNIRVLGVTPRANLRHAASFYADAHPSMIEGAALAAAEVTSQSPILESRLIQYVSDTFRLTSIDSQDAVSRFQSIGFVDGEGASSDRLIFNGNLFRRDNLNKSARVLNSLSSGEQSKMTEFNGLLQVRGCVLDAEAERLLGSILFDKLKAAGVYDLNTVSNSDGEHLFVTSPGAFHKFTDPFVDDAFDMAKALVAALTYGMTMRSGATGRIQRLNLLVDRLIQGRTIGPATAIGQDYSVLENARVVQLIPDGNMFRMRLLKREIGELALQVLSTGDANATALSALPSAAMSGYSGPSPSRQAFRRRQTPPSRRHTQDVLSALRSGGPL